MLQPPTHMIMISKFQFQRSTEKATAILVTDFRPNTTEVGGSVSEGLSIRIDCRSPLEFVIDGDDNLCVICLEHSSNTILLECGHRFYALRNRPSHFAPAPRIARILPRIVENQNRSLAPV